MTMTWVSQLCRSLRAPGTGKRYRNALIGILFVPLNQLIVVPIQLTFDNHQINLPASIIVMLLVLTVMLFANFIHGGTGDCYSRHLKGPTDFLGRHMSFGFVASFIMLSKEHIETGTDVPKIACAFIITSLISYIGCFLFAIGSFRIEECLRSLRKRANDFDTEENHKPSPGPAPLPSKYASGRRISQVSQLTTVLMNNASLSSLETLSTAPGAMEFLASTTPLWISLFLLCIIGLPVYCAAEYDMPLEVFSFTSFWIITVLFQRSLKTCKTLELRPRLRSTLVILFNPVLLTSMLGTAFFWIKAAITHRSLREILSAFRRERSWASIVSKIAADHNPQIHIGAGDLAQALLDAGIVSLGLKMFEYRRELWNSFTTVFSTSMVFATINLFLNVIFAHAMGLAQPDALAFAARNVTIALGVPAVQNLNGSTTLMSALVVFSGMLFQMTGDFLFAWLGIRDRPQQLQQPAMTVCASDEEKGANDDAAAAGHGSNCKVVAAGIAVGINAAAMGTAHLIERDSSATAYSALSMTIFGAITVALTAVPAIADCLISLASR
ncbi:uncharacterized protein BCR38DRAFT_133243 [Pseudomassariella vexata]|uniref:LrgB-like family-domain-containing protein n=1 Tax=Pseudomassariella vexata TaxID=1141098 RepID=A0A1Y2EA64_9PEZI|nr:uncharacterized protein BCR38DRAFT_133243 [Pseudomassariella vexata]ORY68480.1 hypothetical protein BCR38DRAFT_133243 [Pseudomassariella vexata]